MGNPRLLGCFSWCRFFWPWAPARRLEPLGAPSPAGDDAITVGSFNFDESVVLAEIYSQALGSGRLPCATGLTSRAPASSWGRRSRLDWSSVVPEYAGSALQFWSLGAGTGTSDVAKTRDDCAGSSGSGSRRLWTRPLPQDANAFVVTRQTAERFGLRALSDLGRGATKAQLRWTSGVPEPAVVPARSRSVSTGCGSRIWCGSTPAVRSPSRPSRTEMSIWPCSLPRTLPSVDHWSSWPMIGVCSPRRT